MATKTSVAALAATALLALGRPAAAQAVDAEKGTFGLGLMVGEPSGISCKLYLGEESNTAIAAGAGFAFAADGLHAHADFLWHPWILSSADRFVLAAYLGVGARVLDHRRERATDDFHLGARGVIGVVFDFIDLPIDAFAETAAILDYRTGGGDPDHDNLGPGLALAIGARYYF
jgi:hypothetical protein